MEFDFLIVTVCKKKRDNWQFQAEKYLTNDWLNLLDLSRALEKNICTILCTFKIKIKSNTWSVWIWNNFSIHGVSSIFVNNNIHVQTIVYRIFLKVKSINDKIYKKINAIFWLLNCMKNVLDCLFREWCSTFLILKDSLTSLWEDLSIKKCRVGSVYVYISYTI